MYWSIKLTHLWKNNSIRFYEINFISAKKEKKEEKTRFSSKIKFEIWQEGFNKEKKKEQKTTNRLIFRYFDISIFRHIMNGSTQEEQINQQERDIPYIQ